MNKFLYSINKEILKQNVWDKNKDTSLISNWKNFLIKSLQIEM